MNEDNYSVYQGVEPPKLYKDNPELLNEVFNQKQTFNNWIPETVSTNIDFGINNPFENEGYKFIIFNNYSIPQKAKQEKPIQFGKSKQEYINFITPYLHEALENNGIDADKWTPVLVAQTALESGWGNEFSRKNNNFAGIKGKGSGNVTTKEWSPSKGYYTITDSFKKFNSVEEFADEYVKKLKNKFKAFEGSPSYFSANIRKRGYFTAPASTYQNNLNIILKQIKYAT